MISIAVGSKAVLLSRSSNKHKSPSPGASKNKDLSGNIAYVKCH